MDNTNYVTDQASITGAGWRPELIKRLEQYELSVRIVLIYASALAPFIFLQEITFNPGFDLSILIHKDFFKQVILMLLHGNENDEMAYRNSKGAKTLAYRRFILNYRDGYLGLSNYQFQTIDPWDQTLVSLNGIGRPWLYYSTVTYPIINLNVEASTMI